MNTTPPPGPPAHDFFRYDLLTQNALRGVVRDVLARVAREGVPGDHHFYVSFRTTDPGVRMSQRLRERYPTDMTIVLQHQFWDLEVEDDSFEVGLSFGNVPEKLTVPLRAVTGFFDPSVQFGLKFDHPEAEIEDDDGESAPVETLVPAAASNAPEAPAAESAPASTGGAEVVSLDKFRKK